MSRPAGIEREAKNSDPKLNPAGKPKAMINVCM